MGLSITNWQKTNTSLPDISATIASGIARPGPARAQARAEKQTDKVRARLLLGGAELTNERYLPLCERACVTMNGKLFRHALVILIAYKMAIKRQVCPIVGETSHP